MQNNTKKRVRRNSKTNKFKKGYSAKDQNKYDQKMAKEDTSTSGNDPAWYAADPSLLRDAASIPFSWPTGATKVHDLSVWSTRTGVYSDIPGIMSFRTVPAIGTALRSTDPINVAAQSVYSFVRHANSGHSNYDVPDLMLYILAMANFYSFLVWCQRAYGYALTYDQRNRYIPRALLEDNNIDPDDLVNNLANFRFWLNTLIAKAASFAVPATMSIFSRMSFMYSAYYIEGTVVKDQLYQFIPDGFYKFGINSGSSLGELTYEPIDRSSMMTVSDIETYGDTLFNAIWSQEDFGIMSGDILKAYGDRIIKLASVPEFYALTPSFDPMVLTQMKNARLLDADPGTIGQTGTNANVVQVITPTTYTTSTKCIDGSAFTGSTVTIVTAARLATLKDIKCLTVDTDQPTPEVVIEATRLMYGYDSYLAELRVGTEYIRSIIVRCDTNSYYEIPQIAVASQTGGNENLDMMNRLASITRHFHYCPALTFMGSYSSASLAGSDFQVWFDLDNFAVLDNQDIIKMNAAATINMYAVPSIGKV